MNTLPKPRSFLLLAAVAPVTLMLQLADVYAQPAKSEAPVVRRASAHDQREKINAWTVGLAGGLLEGAPIRLAAEMARVVDDGPNLHVLPIVTRGATENVNSLLYLRGVDTAIINSDALEEYKIQVPQIRSRITYLLNLFPSELHIFVRPEITSLQDLAGKKVNFNTQGTAAAYSGPLIFSRLGINVEKTFIPHQVALEQMRKGEIAAVLFITSKPVDAFVRGRWDAGYKFLAVNYDSKFEDYYLPATLEANEYPNLIKQGERISTIAVPTALVAFNWSPRSNRYPARRPLRRLPVLPDRPAAGPGVRSEMEVDQSRRNRPRARPLPGGAGMAGSQGAQCTGAAMKTAAFPLAALLNAAYSIAFAQGASESMAHLRTCSQMERAERLECLETMSRKLAQAARAAAGSDNWLVSETTSPVDYSPVVAATTLSRGGSDSAMMQLSIHCRAGRTELVVAGPTVSRSG